MGWTISIKETKKETKYKIWSTIVDAYITEKWMTKKEIINFFFWHRFREFSDKFMEDCMTFPNGYTEQGTGKRIYNEDVLKGFSKFRMDSLSDSLFYNKFFEELDNIGVQIIITDGKYTIENTNGKII